MVIWRHDVEKLKIDQYMKEEEEDTVELDMQKIKLEKLSVKIWRKKRGITQSENQLKIFTGKKNRKFYIEKKNPKKIWYLH